MAKPRFADQFWALCVVAGFPFTFCLGQHPLMGSDLPSLAEIRQAATEKQALFAELYIRTRVHSEVPGGLAVVASLGKSHIPNRTEVFAFKGDKRYQQAIVEGNTETTAGIRPVVDPEASPEAQERQRRDQAEFDRLTEQRVKAGLPARLGTLPAQSRETCAFDGTEVRHLKRGTGVKTNPATSSVRTMIMPIYWKCVGVFLPNISAPPGLNEVLEASSLPGLLDYGEYTISRGSSAEADCVRISGVRGEQSLSPSGELGPNVPRIGACELTVLLDLDRGHMTRMVETKSDHGFARITSFEPEEIRAGLWLPKKCRVEAWAAGVDSDGPPTMTTHVEVVEWSTEVDDELFDLEFPPGTRVIDIARTEKEGLDRKTSLLTYTIPADRALLDQIIEQKLRGTPRSRSIMPRWLAGTFGALLLALFVVAGFALNNQKRHRAD